MAAMDLFLGPVLLGVILNIWLYGVMVAQTGIYYMTFPRDRDWLKIMVAGIFFIDTLNSLFDIGIVWRYTITLFGNLPGINTSHWLFNVEPVMTVMISSTTQCFFAWRIAKLTGQVWLGWLIALFSFVQFLAGTGTTIGGSIINDFNRFHELNVPIIIWLVVSVVTDVLITSIVSWFLLTHRTGISRTDDMISRIVRLTVQNGLITTIWATLNLITFLTQGTTGTLYLFFQLPLCKLYSNTILSTLNCRAGWGIDSSSSGETGLTIPTKLDHELIKAHTTPQVVTTDAVNRDGGIELQSCPTHANKTFSSGDIESCPHVQSPVTLQLPRAISAASNSFQTSTHSSTSQTAI